MVLRIDDPNCIVYPLEKEMYDDPKIVYHGTSSVFVEKIEKRGWVANDTPYDMNDVKTVCNAYESIGYTESSGYSVLRPYTLGVIDQYPGRKYASFDQSFWRARNYARNRGGETIDSIITAVEDFKDLVLNENTCLAYKQELLRKLSSIPPKIAYYLKHEEELQKRYSSDPAVLNYRQLQEWLKRANDDKYLEGLLNGLPPIHGKYSKMVKTHYPVVYAVRVERTWFDNWAGADSKLEARDHRVDQSLLSNCAIPANRIEARIEYINGIREYRTFSGHPLPLPWEIDVFREWCMNKKLRENGIFR